MVKAFARQDYERNKFEKENWEKYQRGKKLLMMHSFFWPVSDIICGFQMLGGFLVGALMAINGAISIGTYLAYAGLVVWLIWPMRNLGRLIVQLLPGWFLITVSWKLSKKIANRWKKAITALRTVWYRVRSFFKQLDSNMMQTIQSWKISPSNASPDR